MLQLWLRNLLWEVIKNEELFFKNYFFRGEGGGVNYFFFKGEESIILEMLNKYNGDK